MANRTRKITTPDGRIIEGVIMPFQVGGEHWNEYLVDDGSVIRMKPIVTEVIRLDGEYDAKGDPVYMIQAQNVMNISAPDGLRKEGA